MALCTPVPIGRTSIRRDICVLCLATVGLLAPFVNKAAHIDDPLFLWTAKQISIHPLDFYGFSLNWGDHVEPMPDEMINPPLMAYYLAGAAHLLGWSDIALHTAVLPIGILTILGVYFLARHFCRFPLLAAICTLLCPAFLISATSLMCDVPMLCLWIWTLVFWIQGSTGGSTKWVLYLPLAATLLGLAALTKYSAVCLLPLMIAYSLMHNRSRRTLVIQYLSMLIPLAMVAYYNHFTAAHYGRPLFLDAIGFSSAITTISPVSSPAKLFDGVVFLGGSALIAAMLAFIAAPLRVQISILLSIPILALLAQRLLAPLQDWHTNWGFDLQAGLMAAGGIVVGILCVNDLLKSGQSDRTNSIFLLLWTGGVFVFAAKLNWSLNARSMLPLIPPVCMLAERAFIRSGLPSLRPYILAASTAAAIAILVTIADYRSANGNRFAAEQIARKYPGKTVWFSGHWGFQYYMQLHGALPIDDLNPDCKRKDIMVVAMNNYGIPSPKVSSLPLDKITADDSPFVTTQSLDLGAGFYFSAGDRLPYRFGNIPADAFMVLQVMEDVEPAPPSELVRVPQVLPNIKKPGPTRPGSDR